MNTSIADFVTKQNAHNDRLAAAISGLEADLKSMNDTIAEFQKTPGKITAEDQALLDRLEQRGNELAGKLEGLDAMKVDAPALPAADEAVNPNRLPVNRDQTSAQLRGTAAQKASEDPNRVPNPQPSATEQFGEVVPARPTVGPVGPRV